ncbi:MAG: spore maturation protein [Calditrichaeota bacterium]|nr:spore maturation protein [Calditrichota bacterium]
MMNYIWLFLIAVSVVVAAFTGHIGAITKGAFDSAKTAVDIALGLIGIMTLWLGMMKIAEEAGLVKVLARLIRPVSARLFPEIPRDHPAIGAMMLNISANWLGLGNAATPFGIKAMEELQTLNPQKDTASNSMIMFMGLNTASITLVPMTIIAVRSGLQSSDPTAIIGPTIFSSFMATITAVLAVKTFASFENGLAGFKSEISKSWKGWTFFFAILIAILLAMKYHIFTPITENLPPHLFKNLITLISRWTIPLLLLLIPSMAILKKIKIYEVFVEGAKEGFQVAVKIIPFLVAILVAIGMFRSSGAMDFFVTIISPLTNLIGMPADVLPAALMRPLSGSGTLGIITELLKTHGPDSFTGQLASTIYGCTETTFYVIAVYFGAVQVKKIRYAVPAGLIADMVGVLAAVFISRMMFL